VHFYYNYVYVNSVDAEEVHEIRARRVPGVGFGNIFGAGPINLRKNAVDKKQEQNQPKPVPEPVRPSMVRKLVACLLGCFSMLLLCLSSNLGMID